MAVESYGKPIERVRPEAYYRSRGWLVGNAVCIRCATLWRAALEPVKNPPVTRIECPKCKHDRSIFVQD